MKAVGPSLKIKVPDDVSITSEVGIGPIPEGFGIQVGMRIFLPGLERNTAVVAGAALATWWAGSRAANVDATAHNTPAADGAPSQYALQAWEGCRPLQAGDAFTGPITRTLSDGRSVEVSLVPATRDNGALVFDTLVKSGTGSSRTQVAFNSPLLADGVLMRPVDLDAVSREVGGDAAYLHGPHPMQQ